MRTTAGIARALVLGALVAAPSAALADDDPSTIVSELTVTAKPVTPLSGLDVTAPHKKSTEVAGVDISPPKRCLEPRRPPDRDVPAPKLVSTYPAKGDVVRPGLVVVRLSFDLPMACSGSLGIDSLADPCARDGAQLWTLSYDRLNFRVVCHLQPGRRYTFRINHLTPEDFQGLGGRKPGAFELTFTASNEAPVATVREAVAQDPRLAPAAKP
jgi:hypothetical protein